jgi:hypothetical protein
MVKSLIKPFPSCSGDRAVPGDRHRLSAAAGNRTCVNKEKGLKRIIIYLAVCCIVAVVGRPASAQQKGPSEVAAEGLIETVAKGCEKELKMYCKDVTPGEGRVLACLYSFWDKLSDPCDNALYDAAAQLQRAIAALSYVQSECWDDLNRYCAKIQPGEGRLLQCLDRNDAKVTKRCKEAVKDTGLKK